MSARSYACTANLVPENERRTERHKVDGHCVGAPGGRSRQLDCGVEYFPFIVLVGRDGKVAALNVRGADLGPKLAELLGPAHAPRSAVGPRRRAGRVANR